MPTVPNVKGIQAVPPPIPKVMVQPPPEQVVDPAPSPESEPQPEPALTAADYPTPTQDELAEESILTQTVRKRGTMEPLHIDKPEPTYKFTDADRAKAEAIRKANRYDWELSPLSEALEHLADLRAEMERGATIMERRVSELKIERVKCFACDNIINLSEGRWATMRTRNNFETGLPESAYACSVKCGLILNRDFVHPTRVPMAREGTRS